jgi:RND family efflux transporter MFP subunit
MKNTIKEKFRSVHSYYKKHPKRFWFGGIILIIVIYFALPSAPKETVTIVPVSRVDLKQTVLATGQVTAQTDLDLSFSASDIVRSVSVEVGDKVYKGQVLATLDNRDEYASLKSAQAKYAKVEEGSSTEEVAVAQASLDTAQKDLASKQRTQDTLVESARRALMNADLTPFSSGSSGVAPTITGTYTGDADGSYVIDVHPTGNGGYFAYSGIESGTGEISTTKPIALGMKGLFIQFSTASLNTTGTTWTVLLPNVKSVNYLTKLNAYQETLRTKEATLSSAQALVNEKEAELALKKAAARPADLDAADADVLSAQVAYENTILRAPVDGTITRVDTKIGERVDAQKEVMVLQDVTNLYVEANINEANIAKLVLGQPVIMTLDAFGPDMQFTGKIMHIDPSATTDDGVVNYKVKSSIDDGPQKNAVRPGMNANMTITASDTPNVLAVPKAATITKDGKIFAHVITNEKRKKYTDREITLGKEGDGNLAEVVSGLSEGDKIALVVKQ